jgi:dTDP-4-amino-4,6-dideoxygalactose transaminase
VAADLTLTRIPFLRPDPPRLSTLTEQLVEIENAAMFSNYGPVNTRFEARLNREMFGDRGGCLSVNNATTGLMIAIREAANTQGGRRYALMPSFTFAATAHAAMWAGLTPLLCDIDPETWSLCPHAEARLFARYGRQIACIVPYACFGNGLDLPRYARLAAQWKTGVVVDAAASLGSLDAQGNGFGAGFPHAVVYSMHATKTFATAEAGVIHCGDAERLARLRTMGNFGFGKAREATAPGLNAKLSEIGALLALEKLKGFHAIVEHRARLAEAYVRHLPGLMAQRRVGRRLAYQFMPLLLPEGIGAGRDHVVEAMAAEGIGMAHYFSPHISQHAYFKEACVFDDLPTTDAIARRVISLPVSDAMTVEEVAHVCATLKRCLPMVL